MIKGFIFDIGGVLFCNGKRVEENILLIKELKKKHKVGVISNTMPFSRYALEIERIGNLFDVIIFSGEVGFQKPEKEIYLMASQKMGVLEKEVVFIDDLLENIVGAESAGMQTILYKNHLQLKEDVFKKIKE